ncbi:hypothetical protein HGA64_05430 [Candidatus Falkowbacteria bacterium]|nr:hypothetical protein [Candidatus Falkowbacteria bacterium]
MNNCFVMQPFDGGVFDKRYDDVFSPAINDAGLNPYRVDRDPSVSIPIDEIESGIRRSELCLAEITNDNPNVWFELGYAIGLRKEVVLVCSEERKTKFPFDVQHRNIIRYKTESSQDFSKLRVDIKKRIIAIQEKISAIDSTSEISPVAATDGLLTHEMVALVAIMQNSFMTGGSVSAWIIKEDMGNAGYTDIAVGLSLKSLLNKKMISTETEHDRNGESYSVYVINSSGEEWLLQNQNKLVLKKEKAAEKAAKYNFPKKDELPF